MIDCSGCIRSNINHHVGDSLNVLYEPDSYILSRVIVSFLDPGWSWAGTGGPFSPLTEELKILAGTRQTFKTGVKTYFLAIFYFFMLIGRPLRHLTQSKKFQYLYLLRFLRKVMLKLMPCCQ